MIFSLKYDINVVIVDWSSAAAAASSCWFDISYNLEYSVLFGKINLMLGAAYIIYGCAAHNTIVVGESIALIVTSLGLSPANVHCVGHSLGSHVCGFFGKYYQKIKSGKIISRITGQFYLFLKYFLNIFYFFKA